jgi:hypothetical protein
MPEVLRETCRPAGVDVAEICAHAGRDVAACEQADAVLASDRTRSKALWPTPCGAAR